MRFFVPLASLCLAVMFSSCSTVQPSSDVRQEGDVPVAEESVSGFLRTRYCAKAGEDVRKEAEKKDNAKTDGAADAGTGVLAGVDPDAMVPAPELSPASVDAAEGAGTASSAAPAVMAHDGTASSPMRQPRNTMFGPLAAEPAASAPRMQAPPTPAAELKGLRSPQLPTGLPMSLDGKILQQQGE